MDLSIKINGKEYVSEVEPRTLLVDYLRDSAQLTGTKVGCNSGMCGTCTVLVNGKATKSCQVLALEAAGSEVTTIEGLAQGGELHPLQQAFWDNYAVQNGFLASHLFGLKPFLFNSP